MTEEEKAEIEKELKKQAAPETIKAEAEAEASRQEGIPGQTSTSRAESPKDDHLKELKDRKKKLTPEQRQKLEALEKERHEARMKRVKDLKDKLIERYMAFINYASFC